MANGATFTNNVYLYSGATASLSGDNFSSGDVYVAPQLAASLVGNNFPANSTVNILGGYVTGSATLPSITNVSNYYLDSFNIVLAGSLYIRSGATLTIASGNTIKGSGLYVSDDGSGGTLVAEGVTFSDQVSLGPGSNGTVEFDTFTDADGNYFDGQMQATVTDDNFATSKAIAQGAAAPTIDLEGNYWGTTNLSVIAQTKIWDHTDDASLPVIDFTAPLASAPVLPTGTDGGELISESVPVGTQVAAGAAFTELVTMKNTGTTTWIGDANGYTLNRSGVAQFGEGNFYVVLDQASVSPGSTGTFTMNLTAPATAGTYTEIWQMNSASPSGRGLPFGDMVTVSIVVPTAPVVVTGVSSTQAAGTYGTGTVIPITVTFSEPVNASGTPQLALNDGGVACYDARREHQYGAHVRLHRCNRPEHFGPGLCLDRRLTGGSIHDTAGNAAVLTLPPDRHGWAGDEEHRRRHGGGDAHTERAFGQHERADACGSAGDGTRRGWDYIQPDDQRQRVCDVVGDARDVAVHSDEGRVSDEQLGPGDHGDRDKGRVLGAEPADHYRPAETSRNARNGQQPRGNIACSVCSR